MPTELAPSVAVTVAHVALAVVLAAWLALGVRRAFLELDGSGGTRPAIVFLGLCAVWLCGTWIAASSNVFLDFQASPPRFVFLMVPALAVAAVLAMNRFGLRLIDALPLWLLIATQSFRIAVEFVLWRLCREGVLPVQMTFEGANFDLATGISALVVAALARSDRLPLSWIRVWNYAGLFLLARITAIAVRSMPGPLRAYTNEPANTIVLHTLFIWIPAFYVVTAWFLHVLVFRALARERRRLASD